MLSLKPWLVGKDPLEIDKLYTQMGQGTSSLSGTRTDGSAHNLMRAVSGIEMALWDLAGKILEVPTSTLLGGRFRDKVRVYDHAAPRNMLDKASVRRMGGEGEGAPQRLHLSQVRIPEQRSGHRQSTRPVQSRADDERAHRRPEGIRELPGSHRLGSRSDGALSLGVRPAHGHSDCRRRRVGRSRCGSRIRCRLTIQIRGSGLCAASKVPICMGENLARREGFKDFILNQGCDILHPDLRNSGGFLETKRIADMAHVFGLPMANHNTGSQVNTYASAQWASSIRDYISLETITGEGGWMDQVLLLDGPYIKDGFIQVTDKPGLGIELNPGRRPRAPGYRRDLVGMKRHHRQTPELCSFCELRPRKKDSRRVTCGRARRQSPNDRGRTRGRAFAAACFERSTPCHIVFFLSSCQSSSPSP